MNQEQKIARLRLVADGLRRIQRRRCIAALCRRGLIAPSWISRPVCSPPLKPPCPADIPTIDLKLLALSLQKRIIADSRLLLEVNVELLRREPSVVISTTVGDKIPSRAENAE